MLLAIGLSTALSACGGGGGNGSEPGNPGETLPAVGNCESITGGESQVSSIATPGGSVLYQELAIDGNFGTHAEMTAIPGGTTSLRATAQSGIVFPAGTFAGITAVCEQESNGYLITISTLLGGTPQESAVSACDPVQQGFVTNKPFDAVQVDVQVPPQTHIYTCYPCAAERSLSVYEFCGGT
jgi:hypothetical protein